MDFNTFNTLTSSVFEHNVKIQKKLEEEKQILTIKDLHLLVEEFPLSSLYLHYPTDSQTKNLDFCYSSSHLNNHQLLPILSCFKSDYITIFSYLPQEELNQLHFENYHDFDLNEDYYNMSKLTKFLFNNNFSIFNPDKKQMLFMEHVPDCDWVSASKDHKTYQPFSILSLSTFMLWNAYFFTPRY